MAIGGSTKDFIQAGVSENSLQAYRRALLELDKWTSDAGNDFQSTERTVRAIVDPVR